VASALIALAICVLIAHGSWKMTALNLDNIAPVTGLPMAVVYASGLVFAISAIGLLSKRIYRVLFAHVSEQELLGVKESEELADHAPAH
jgi:TRAP-type C4-dicarboxylate transport system permease small subunit